MAEATDLELLLLSCCNNCFCLCCCCCCCWCCCCSISLCLLRYSHSAAAESHRCCWYRCCCCCCCCCCDTTALVAMMSVGVTDDDEAEDDVEGTEQQLFCCCCCSSSCCCCCCCCCRCMWNAAGPGTKPPTAMGAGITDSIFISQLYSYKVLRYVFNFAHTVPFFSGKMPKYSVRERKDTEFCSPPFAWEAQGALKVLLLPSERAGLSNPFCRQSGVPSSRVGETPDGRTMRMRRKISCACAKGIQTLQLDSTVFACGRDM